MPPIRNKNRHSNAQAALLVPSQANSGSSTPDDGGDDNSYDVHIIQAPDEQSNLLGGMPLPYDVLYLVPRSLDHDAGQDVVKLMRRLDKIDYSCLNQRWVPLFSPRRELWEAWTRLLVQSLESTRDIPRDDSIDVATLELLSLSQAAAMSSPSCGNFSTNNSYCRSMTARTRHSSSKLPVSQRRRVTRSSQVTDQRLNVCTA